MMRKDAHGYPVMSKGPFRQDRMNDSIADLAEPSYPRHNRDTWHKVRHKVGTRSGSGRRTTGLYFGVSRLGFVVCSICGVCPKLGELKV